jgi:hypothetical protein
MKITRKFALLLLTPALAGSMNAAIIATEYFNGYGSSNLTMEGISDGGGTGWTSEWGAANTGTDDNEYRAGSSLSISKAGYDNSDNLSGATHGAVGYDANNSGPSASVRTFSTTATTVWFSILVNRGNTTSNALLWIDTVDAGSQNDFIGLLGGEFEMRYNNVTTTNNTLVAADTTYLILAKAEIDVSGNNDRLSFWFDPTLTGGEAGLGTATSVADNADTFGTTIDGIAVQMNGEGLLDAIRVGTTFADVVPEPSVALLGGLGLLGLLRRRRSS